MKAEYVRAVRLLREADAGEKEEAWARPLEHPAGSLFLFCTPDGRACPPPSPGAYLGCPIMVAGGKYRAWTNALTKRVRAAGLPSSAGELGDQQLQKLARLQEHMDETIRDAVWRRENACALSWPWWPEDTFLVEGDGYASTREEGRQQKRK